MTYPECMTYLNSLGDEVLTMKCGLETTRKLMKELGNPQLDYPSVNIAGTVGKGSVASLFNSMSTTCGIRTGLYTSPHLISLKERFLVGGLPIKTQDFSHYFTKIIECVKRLNFAYHPTYFEVLTALAFLYFRDQKIELAILETGMGGRLDSTNVTEPLLSILTRVGMDHQQFLGDNIAKIAREKAGILRKGRAAFVAPQNPEVQKVLLEEANRKGSELHELDSTCVENLGSKNGRHSFRFRGRNFQLRLLGAHQVENAALALQAIESLKNHGFNISEDCCKKGMEKAECVARIQKVREHPAVFVDGAHNLDSARSLTKFISKHTLEPRFLIFGMMRDKDISGVAKILIPHFNRIYLTDINSPRSASIAELQQVIPSGIPALDTFGAYNAALDECSTLVFAGSFYLAGEILPQLSSGASSQERKY